MTHAESYPGTLRFPFSAMPDLVPVADRLNTKLLFRIRKIFDVKA